jgi:diguanylate cyclase (GGDEF)-like protein
MSLVDQFSRRRSRASIPPPGLPGTADLPVWRRLLAPPDPLQMDVGADGETIVGRVRILLILLLLPLPLINLILDPDPTAGTVGLVACVAALSAAAAALHLLRKGFYEPWLGLLTSLLDVTLVSGTLAAFLVLGQPIAAFNSRLLFEVYFLAIGGTALRYDARISAAAGIAAFVQYLALLLIARSHWDLTDPALPHNSYGAFEWATQVSRLLLLAVSTMLAVAIVLRSQRLRLQSRSDRLTGLPNRIFFDERVQTELARARRYSQPVALAMIDVDHFKKFNDTWGHAAGDVALRAVAHAILDSIRESDLVVRYGGEEFVALFPDMGSVDAMERVEQIRRSVEALPLSIPRREHRVGVTISIGVAVYGVDGTTAEDLLDCADARMFEAKKAGRNRVVGPAPAAPPGPANAGGPGRSSYLP